MKQSKLWLLSTKKRLETLKFIKMNNATQYRRENVIGEGKRIIFFINNELSADERARVVRKKGVETLMPDDIFKKFKEWIKQDNRFKK